jgi:hypothetical protein
MAIRMVVDFLFHWRCLYLPVLGLDALTRLDDVLLTASALIKIKLLHHQVFALVFRRVVLLLVDHLDYPGTSSLIADA